jgi:predicted RNA-binding Zn-ribbon protein involved in translation (DUF1610 family)
VRFGFDGDCPDCGGFIWRDGPRGGIAQNMECVGCGTRLNVAMWHGKFVLAERIPSEKESGGVWREDMFPRVLQ